MNNEESLEYDRSKDGWTVERVTTTHTLSDGTVVTSTHAPERRVRPESERERCGPYTLPDGEEHWGDHRVTFPGTTCEEVQCFVKHHPDIEPGWAESMEGFYERAGVNPIAAAMEGWDAAGHLSDKIGSNAAWIAAHVVLDALRDAGYEVVKKTVNPKEQT